MISIFFLLLIAVLLYLGLASPDFLPVSINSSLLIAAAVILLII
ncbi:MAG: hypothetical protein QM532_03910 [Cyanobium sp. MAG06]|nr:hypothetical protein [Cyanobium sp. MAG06]